MMRLNRLGVTSYKMKITSLNFHFHFLFLVRTCHKKKINNNLMKPYLYVDAAFLMMKIRRRPSE
jgi:hypothetical protein